MSNFNKSKPGRQGEWILTLTRKNAEDEVELVGNGLYWMVADSSGGWSRLLTKLTANKITMDGARCPKSDAAVHDSLRDSRDTLALKGFTVELPTKGITFTKLIKELVQRGALPDPNASSVGGSVPATVEAPIVPANEYAQEVMEVFNDGAAPEAPPAAPSDNAAQEVMQNANEPNHTEADFSLLVERTNILEEYVKELEGKNRQLHDINLKNEERLAQGAVDTTDKMVTSVRGVLDHGLTNMASSMEFRLGREMGHIGKELKELFQDHVVTPIDEISQQVCSLSTTVDALSHQMVEVVQSVTKTEQQMVGVMQSAAKTEQQQQRTEQHQQKILNTMGQLGTNVHEILKITKAMEELGRHSTPSFVTPPNKIAVQAKATVPPTKCTYCHATGHLFSSCRVRPEGHMCIRCRSPRHKDDDCPTLTQACSVPTCKQIGHASVIHATADPKERMAILQKFGPESLSWFKEFFNTPGAGANKKLKY